MNSAEIKVALSKLPIHTDVFAVDQRPTCTATPAAYVFNLDPHDEPGSHWVAVFLSRRNHADYFDSFGRPPTALQDFLKPYIVTYNDVAIQHPLSIRCGEHCISFLYHRYKGVDLKAYVRGFSHDLSKNDRRVTRYSKNL
jgi:hypothetical protein